MTEHPIAALFGLNRTAEQYQKELIAAYGQPKYRDDDRPVAFPDLYLGLELEIEEMRRRGGDTVLGMTATKDGSLRGDYAYEYITFPTKLKHLRNLLNTAVNDLQLGPNNYSDRCSIHAHANVLDFTEDQLKSVFLAYQTLEGLLFKFVGHYRDEGLYAVPWSGTKIAERLFNNKLDRVSIKKWQKYTALNVIPVASQGTIEFRHLEGTHDVERIMQWLNIIGSILRFGKATKFDDHKAIIMDMNTVSSYDKYLQDVFKGGFEAPLVSIPDYKYELECGVMHTKHMLIQRQEEKPEVWDDMEPEEDGMFDAPAGRNMEHILAEHAARQAELRVQIAADAAQNVHLQALNAQWPPVRPPQEAQQARNPAVPGFRVRRLDEMLHAGAAPQAVPERRQPLLWEDYMQARRRHVQIPFELLAPANRVQGVLFRYQQVYGDRFGLEFYSEDLRTPGRTTASIFSYYP